MMVSNGALVATETWKNNDMLRWRDDLRYFHTKFEYGLKDEMHENELAFQTYNVYLYKLYVVM